MSLYDDLGVPPNASQEEIKAAWRRKAKATHPDKGGSAKAFAVVETAYRILSDEEKKSRYDASGETDLPKDPLTEARQNVAQLFLQAAEGYNEDTCDMIAAVRDVINRNLSAMAATKVQNKTKQRKLERVLKRLKHKRKDGLNIIAGAVEQRIRGLDETNKEIEEATVKGNLMLEVVAEYEYEVSTDPKMEWQSDRYFKVFPNF